MEPPLSLLEKQDLLPGSLPQEAQPPSWRVRAAGRWGIPPCRPQGVNMDQTHRDSGCQTPFLYLILLYNTILSVVGFNFDVLAIPHSKIARVLNKTRVF